jgi:hypothetical protein
MKLHSTTNRNWLFGAMVLVLTCVSAEGQQSSTTVTETRNLSGYATSQQVSETRSEANGVILETRVTKVPSVNGGYRLFSGTERETVKVDANTVRVVERSFFPDGNGERRFFGVTESVTTTLPGGRERTVRTTSNADPDGHLRPMQRQVQESAAVDATTTQTTTSVFAPGVNGFVLAREIQKLEQRKSDGVVAVQTTEKRPNSSGSMITTQVTNTVEKKAPDGTVTAEKRVLRGDPGKVAGESSLSTTDMTVTKQWKDASGEHSSKQTYSTYSPGTGISTGGELHVEEIVTTTRRTTPDGHTETVQQAENADPLQPGTMKPAAVVIETSRFNGRGQTETKTTTQFPASNGSMNAVWVSDGQETKMIP